MKKFQWLWPEKCRRISFILFFQFLVLGAMAQVKISGVVTGADGKGLPAVSVAVHGTTIGTVTDENGNYSLTGNLKPGNYVLDFSGIGLKSSSQSIQVTSAPSYTANA